LYLHGSPFAFECVTFSDLPRYLLGENICVCPFGEGNTKLRRPFKVRVEMDSLAGSIEVVEFAPLRGARLMVSTF
jgi:hypothetical protein